MGSPDNSPFTISTNGHPSISEVSQSFKDVVTIASAMSYNSCSMITASPTLVTIVPSTGVNQIYDLCTGGPSTVYTVPAFTLNPSTSIGVISYTDAAPISGVVFDSATRSFDWSLMATTGNYSLSMQGSLTGSTSMTTSFTLTIIKTSLVVASLPVN